MSEVIRKLAKPQRKMILLPNGVSAEEGFFSTKDAPFPVAPINDPDRPIGTVYHGSFHLGREAPEAMRDPNWKSWGAVPFSGTDLTDAVGRLRQGEAGGHMGPAYMYTSTDQKRAENFGPPYRVEIGAAPRDFIGMYHGGGHGPLESPLRPELLKNLLDRVGEMSGKPIDPSEATLKTVFGRLKSPAETTVNSMSPEMVGSYGDKVSEIQSKMLADAIQQSGAAGLTERYSGRFDPASGEQHYAIYNPAVISRLVKMGALAPVAAGAASQQEQQK